MLDTLILEAEKKEAVDGKHLRSQHELDSSIDEGNFGNTDNVTMDKDAQINSDENWRGQDNIEPNRMLPSGKRERCEQETYWKKNKHHGCTAGTNSFVYKGYALLMTKVDVSSYNPWGMYNYYRMQVKKKIFLS